MCSISGVVTRAAHPPTSESLGRMLQAQLHRGPDDRGEWTGELHDWYIGLASTRLAILDLGTAGHQPMLSACGKHVLVYNGELYNFVELRDELGRLGRPCRTHSDTEVVLQALLAWGELAVERFNGMWAFAWLDTVARRLVLCRDRFGVKPLYLYRTSSAMYFASEIKGILAGTRRRFDIDTGVVARFVQQSLTDAQERTFFAGIEALPAGSMLSVPLGAPELTSSQPKRYWWLPSEVQDDSLPHEAQRIEAVRELFLDSVRLRLRSDVPVGVLLSGGLDSSAITAAMHRILGPDADLHPISAVADDPRYSEQHFIDLVTTHFGCRTSKLPFTIHPTQLVDLLETVTFANDEPIGGLGNIAHYLLMRHARELGVTVILSGQGADELLCGYLKYLGFYLASLARGGQWQRALRVLAGFVGNRTVLQQIRLRELRRYLPIRVMNPALDARGPLLLEQDANDELGLNANGVFDRQILDMCKFSVPSLVHIEDRMSMAASREIRLPFLDYRLVKLLLPLPASDKLRDGWTKWIFRQAMQGLLPSDITWRKDKRHFVTPEERWFKHELRGPLESLLEGELLSARAGLIDQHALRRLYSIYRRQPRDGGLIAFRDVFNPIALEVWMRVFDEHLGAPHLTRPPSGALACPSPSIWR